MSEVTEYRVRIIMEWVTDYDSQEEAQAAADEAVNDAKDMFLCDATVESVTEWSQVAS